MLKYDQTFLKNLTVLVIYLIYFNGLTLSYSVSNFLF